MKKKKIKRRIENKKSKKIFTVKETLNQLKKLIPYLCYILCAIFIYQNVMYVDVTPWKQRNVIQIDNVCACVSDIDGGYYIVDQAGYRLSKVDETGKIEHSLLMEEDGQWKIVSGTLFSGGLLPMQDGSVYVLENGFDFWIDGQRVYRRNLSTGTADKVLDIYYDVERYDGAGNINNTVTNVIKKKGAENWLQLEYGQEHQVLLEGGIVNLQEVNERACAIMIQGDEIQIIDLEARLIKKSYRYQDAQRKVRYVLIHPITGELTAMLKSGEIVKIDQDGNSESIYNRLQEDKAANRNPWGYTITKDGTYYVTDMNTRTICKLNPETKTLEAVVYGDERVQADFVPDEQSKIEQNVYYQLDSTNQLTTFRTGLAASSSVGRLTESGVFESLESLHYPVTWFVRSAVCWLMVAYMAGLALFVLWRIFRAFSKNVSMQTKIVATAIAGLIVFCAILCGIIFPIIWEQLSSQAVENNRVVANMVIRAIPAEALSAIETPEDYDSENYQKIRESVTKCLTQKDGTLDDYYCILYSIRDNTVYTRFRLEEPGTCYANEWEPINELEMLKSGVGNDYSVATSEGRYTLSYVPIYDKKGNAAGLVEVGCYTKDIEKKAFAVVLRLMLTVIAFVAIVVIVGIEMLGYYRGHTDYLEKQSISPVVIPSAGLLRFLVYLIFFIINLPTSFVAIYAMELAEDGFFGIPPSICAAIPISLEVVSGAVFSVLGAKVINRLGQRRASVISAALMVAGQVCRFIPNIFCLALGGVLQGSGWGTLLIVVNLLIAANPDEEEQKRGFAGYNIGLQDGVNAGIVCGGFLLNWMSFHTVFLVGAVLSAFVLVYVRHYIIDNSCPAVEEEHTEEQGQISLVRFLFSPRVFSYLFFLMFPLIAAGYFLNYLYPILAAESGLEETYIAYSYLINSMCILALGNLLTNVLSEKIGHKLSMVLCSAIYAATFAMVAFNQSLIILMASLVFLGIAASFGGSVHSAHFEEIKEVHEYGYDKALGIKNVVDNLSETGGSLIFGYVLVIGLKKGLLVIGGGMMVLALLFAVINTNFKDMIKGYFKSYFQRKGKRSKN